MRRFALCGLAALGLLIILQFSLMANEAVSVMASVSEGTTSTQPNQPIDQPAGSSGVLFIENVGQFDDGARFQVRGGEGTIWLAPDALWITRMEAQKAADELEPDLMGQPEAMRQVEEEPRTGVNIKLAFVGANSTPTIEPFNRLESKVSYFMGNNPDEWQPDVPVWGGVRYVDLYPGVDLEVTSEGSQLVQRLVAEEGADLDAVRLRVEGADELSLDGDTLALETVVGEFNLPLLQVVAEDGTRLATKTRKAQLAGVELSAPFATTESTPRAPSQQMASSALLYSTFLGGSDQDEGRDIAFDSAGQVVVTGYTESSDFPTTPGAFDTTPNPFGDVFISKLNADGSALLYSTFLGGDHLDDPSSLVLDSADQVVVTGSTQSSDFPTTPGAYDTESNLAEDIFITKLNSDGSALVYSTFLGHNGEDDSFSLALDSAEQVVLTGQTSSSDFPTTPGAYDTTHNGSNGSRDVFISKLNADGSDLVYSTFLGGSGSDGGYSLALDEAGQVVLTGHTNSSDFPTTSGAYDTTHNGADDVFISKLNVDGSALVYSTFLGGSSGDESYSLALDSTGQAVVTGSTFSSDFPTTPGAYDPFFNNSRDGFISKLNADGSALEYSTFLGGNSLDYSYSLALDDADQVVLTGQTGSSDFPTTEGAYNSTLNGSADGFISKLNADGSALLYSTFFGGSSSDWIFSLALDGASQVVIVGHTDSSDFPTTLGAYDTTFNDTSDADVFVAKFAMETPSLSISKSGTESALAGEPIAYTLSVSNTGSLTATNLIISDTLPTGATYVSGGTLAGNVVSWNVPSLAAGSSTTVQFVVTASAGTITNSDYGVTADGGYSATGSEVVVTEVSTPPPPGDSLLAIYALAFDTLPTSDLSWAYSDAIQGLRAATANDPNKRAIVLVDMPGDANTFVYDLQAGSETLISGLPDASGNLSSAIYEYDMTDGATLGGFLLWARNTYFADKTTFSYVGHGAPLVPETDFDTVFDASLARRTSSPDDDLFPLPIRGDVFPTFTDATPNAKILSVYQLSEALRIGSNNGANPFAVADVVHCFAASIEEFYAISPYSEAMTGSPNYAFFAPEMLGEALDAINQSTDAHTIADSIIEEYHSAIESYDDASTPEDEHPRLLVAVDSDKIAGIKQKWDEVSYYLWQNFDKTKIESAYLSSTHYDTTYCLQDDGTQDWALASPDAVVDLYKFATELGDEFASPVSVPVNTLKLLIDEAITSRYQQNGVPWFANVSPQPIWNFDNHAGIGIYADLVGTPVGSETHLSWQAHFYTDTPSTGNPHPYTFLQGGFADITWADIFNRYWEGSTNLQTDACLPQFPPLLSTGELAVTEIIFPRAATVTNNSPVRFMAAISTTQPAVDTSVAFTVTQSGSTVFTEVVHIPGLLLTGTHPVEASQVWSPVLADTTQAEPFTVEVMVDHDNHVLEPDELNNALTTSGVVAPAPVVPRPIITATLANNAQWITDALVSLDVVQDPSTSPPDVGTVEVLLYQYVAGSSPTTQVPALVNSQTFGGVTLPQSLNVSLSTLNPGPVVLHVWAWSTGGITVYPSIVQFNYVPPNTPLATGQQHDFLFHVDAGDTLDVDLNALSGDANMFMWMPTNFGTPTWSATAVGDDVLTLNAPVTGEYLLSVYGESGGDYTLTTTRNGVPYARRAQARANNPNAYVPESRPTFIEVIPEQPLPPTAITLDHLAVRSRASGWSFLLIGLLLAGLMGVVMRRGRD